MQNAQSRSPHPTEEVADFATAGVSMLADGIERTPAERAETVRELLEIADEARVLARQLRQEALRIRDWERSASASPLGVALRACSSKSVGAAAELSEICDDLRRIGRLVEGSLSRAA